MFTAEDRADTDLMQTPPAGGGPAELAAL